MPLVLSLRENEDFFVDDQRFEVTKIHHPMRFDVQDCAGGETFEVGSDKNTEITGDVFVSAGHHPQSSTVRVVIDAPGDVVLLRGDKKRAMESEGA